MNRPLTHTLFVVLFCVATSANAQDSSKTVRVFVLAGQSNMQGHAVVDFDHPEHYNGGKGNLNDVIARTGNKFAQLKSGDQWSVRDDVAIRFITEHETKTGGLSIGYAGYEGQNHFGPELQFGHVVGGYFDEPVLLIKTAWGGKSLKVDFRSPSAVNNRGGEIGPYYQKMIQQVKDGLANARTEFPEFENATFEINGFVWQQGWNDMIDEEARNEYFENLVDLIDDVRTEWASPALPVVVGELGNGGKDADQSMKHFRGQQSRIDAHPAFVGNVLFAKTVQHARPADQSPNTGHLHHWFGNAESYLMVGNSLGESMVKLFKQPREPRVLIIGDSISIGYTPYVKKAFQQEAFVVRPMMNHRNPENCAGTDKGLLQIDRWLTIGGGQWDVIHFNFGLHDLKHVQPDTQKNSNNPAHPEQTPLDEYETQLREITQKLKATGATVVFGLTTDFPAGVKPFRDPQSAIDYNAVARKVMAEFDIQINDLYTLSRDRMEEIQLPMNVHFKPEGSKVLGQQVVEHIRSALQSRSK